jgi:hypothetical protein
LISSAAGNSSGIVPPSSAMVLRILAPTSLWVRLAFSLHFNHIGDITDMVRDTISTVCHSREPVLSLSKDAGIQFYHEVRREKQMVYSDLHQQLVV